MTSSTAAPGTTPHTSPFGGAYAGRRVLVTGVTGFKGAWLALWLQRLGAEVVGFSLAPPTSPSLFDEMGLATELEWIEGDVRDQAAVNAAVVRARPDIVLHLAAQPLVRRSYADPVETFATNVLGTAHVLDAVRRNEVGACVNVTSDKCYENVEQPHGYRESDPMGGHDPYSASKGCAELVASSFARSFFAHGASTLLASVRAGNVIGGGDWSEDRLVPDCIRAYSAGESVEIRNPHATRPWQHVLEPLSGYLQVGAQLLERQTAAAGAWNFGPLPTGNLTVGDVVARVTQAWGDPALAMQYVPDPQHLHEATLLQLDVTKAVTRLGWRPVLDAPEAIDRTVAWYRARHESGDGFDARAATHEQIAQYERDGAGVASWAPAGVAAEA